MKKQPNLERTTQFVLSNMALTIKALEHELAQGTPKKTIADHFRKLAEEKFDDMGVVLSCNAVIDYLDENGQ